MHDVIIIGGGLSGLSAAVRLAREGVRVALFERTARFGGRCYSYRDSVTGDVVDNGQHVLVGAYHNLLTYLDIIGTRNYLKKESQLRLPFYHPRNGFTEFKINRLPRPFNLTAGLLRFPLLSPDEKRDFLRIGFNLKRLNSGYEAKLAGKSIAQWLTECKQSEAAKNNFWYPVSIAVMNELPEKASALLFARALKRTFYGSPSDSALLIPTIGQTELYSDGAVEFLKTRKCTVNLKREIRSLLIEKNRITGVRLENDTIVKAGSVISAVPFHGFLRLLPDHVKNTEFFRRIQSFKSSPIISFHLWFESAFTDIDYVGCINFHIQWIFNRRKIFGEGKKNTFYITAVISGAHDYVHRKKEDLVHIALEDIYKIFPKSRKSRLIRSIIIKERNATLSASPDIEPYRPPAETPLRDLILAGDWTATGLPATIEGAVMSGFRAADLYLSK